MEKPIGPPNRKVKMESSGLSMLILAASCLLLFIVSIGFKCEINTYASAQECVDKLLTEMQRQGEPFSLERIVDINSYCKKYDR